VSGSVFHLVKAMSSKIAVFWVARLNAFEISWLVTDLVTVDGNSETGKSWVGSFQ